MAGTGLWNTVVRFRIGLFIDVRRIRKKKAGDIIYIIFYFRRDINV